MKSGQHEQKLKFRICLFTGGIQPPEACLNQANLATWVYLASKLGSLTVIARSPDARARSYTRDSVQVMLLPSYPSPLRIPNYALRAVSLALALHRQQQFDLWVADEPLIAGPVTLLLKWITGKKLMTQIQGDLFDLDSPRWSKAKLLLVRRLTRTIARRSDLVRVSSQQAYDSARRYRVRPERLVYIHSRCNTQVFRFDECARKRLRAEQKLGENPTIITVGALNASKGLSYLMEALAKLVQEGRRFHWLVVGDGMLRPALESQAWQLGLTSRVHFVGFQQYARIPAWLSAADVLVQPSMDEGLPRSVLEAMSIGLPVVSSEVGGLPEVVRPGETGFLVPRGDIEALARALRALDADPDLRRRLGDAGRRLVEEKYSFEKVMPSFARAIWSLLTREGTAGGHPKTISA